MLRTSPRLLVLLPLAAALACRTSGPRPAGGEAAAFAAAPIAPVALYADSKLGLEVARGTLTLPARYERPALRPAAGESGVAQVYLVREEPDPWRGEPEERGEAEEGGEPDEPAASFPPGPSGPDAPVRWQVLALRRGSVTDVALELELDRGQPAQRIGWRIGAGAPGTRGDLQSWAAARFVAQDLFGPGDGPLQAPLLASAIGAYGLDERLGEAWERAHRGDADGREPSFLALLGGRAAVDETLQLDRQLAASGAGNGAGSIPIDRVEGVKVEAHPWKELLAGRAAPRLPLADCVPVDRAMLYLPRPKEAVDGLEHGAAGFLHRVSSFAREGRIDHAVIDRTLEDLALGDGLGRELLSIGAIREAVLFTPDLSLLTGTEVTVIAEVSPLFQPLLPIGDGEVKEKATPGGPAWRARRGTRVFVSTSRAELDRALALDAAGGAGSLGRSDELSFLLLQLAPTDRTQAFAYLSDPFIRRLVGPAQRIGRLRLDRARADMERLAGAALLRKQDVPGDVSTIASLKAMGYLPADYPADAWELRPDGRVASPIYGPLERLHPVSRVEPATVSAAEAELYRRFRDQYARYWRRYFDPIAIRFDDRGDGARELETFILPLLDSSIYRQLARELAPKARPSMATPRWAFPASLAVSFQLPERVAKEATRPGQLPRALNGVGGGALDELAATLAPTVHVAFPDAAPILQVGGGSALGPAAASALDGREPMIGILAAAFTRPMVAAIELKDPERARRALDRITAPVGPARPSRRGDWLSYRLARDEAGRLLLTADFLGLVTLRHALRIEDRWLVIANDTTLPARLVEGAGETRGAAAALELEPGSLRLGRASAWQAASEAEADAAFAAQHWLAPWLSGGATVVQAQAASRALLGAAPPLDAEALLPGPNGTFEHRRFGTRARPRIPALEAKGDFGLFEGIARARVEMAFEGDGLRTRVTWRGSPEK